MIDELKLYVAHFKGIDNPLYFVAKDFETAFQDAKLFGCLEALHQVSSSVHIDFKREVDMIKQVWGEV